MPKVLLGDVATERKETYKGTEWKYSKREKFQFYTPINILNEVGNIYKPKGIASPIKKLINESFINAD